MTPNSADSSARVFSPESAAIATRALNSALCCFLLMPTSHAPLDRSAFSLSRCPKIRSRRSPGLRRHRPQKAYPEEFYVAGIKASSQGILPISFITGRDCLSEQPSLRHDTGPHDGTDVPAHTDHFDCPSIRHACVPDDGEDCSSRVGGAGPRGNQITL